MASHDFPESDWKAFRELQQVALERFCERVLEEVQTILRDGSRSHHERREYLVLGTLGTKTWRRGLSGSVTVQELVDHMADFKDYMRIDYTPGGWYRSDETAS
jgi:hypothetical protein